MQLLIKSVYNIDRNKQKNAIISLIFINIINTTKPLMIFFEIAVQYVTITYVLLQYDSLDFYYKFVLIAIYVVMAIVETTRLYLGYIGNLQERVWYDLRI